MIRKIAHNATEAASVAARAVEAVGTTTETVTRLGDSSREIGDVVKVITSIAEQTNLLALNATIETAAGSGQIAENIETVAAVAQATTQHVGASQEAADELAAVSSRLQELVVGFRF